MSPDLSGGHLEDPQTLNKYVYVRDNPLSLTDPTGLDFYLQCASSTQNPATCQQVTVGYDKDHNPQTAWVQGITNADKSFTATQIGNDANGGLIDKTTGTGAYTASVGPSGVSFSQDGSTSSSMGVFVNHDANPTSVATSIQGTVLSLDLTSHSPIASSRQIRPPQGHSHLAELPIRLGWR